MKIDPGVELLADIPIIAARDDLFGRQRLAVRLVELLVGAPESAPRIVALTARCGEGKSSVLNLVRTLLDGQAELATVHVDAQHGLLATIGRELEKLFSQLGVVETRDKVRDTLVSYGGAVSNLLRLGGVKVDVAGALERSPEAMRAEIAQNLAQAGKRLVIVVDHLDRIPATEIAGAFAALRMYAEIQNVAILLAVDRSAIADQRAFERLVQVELQLPAVDRTILARVMVGGLERIAKRLRRDLQPVIVLFDVEDGLGLTFVETARDTKRAINALAAALPLIPDEQLYRGALEVLLSVLRPQADTRSALQALAGD